MKKTKDPEVISGLKERLAWIVSGFSLVKSDQFILRYNVFLILFRKFQDKQLKSASIKHTDKEILVKHKKKEREAAKQGKQPYYLKKCILSLS